jgi:predicted CoA-binding protein
LAKENGLDVLFNRCMMAEHMRLFKWINYSVLFL